MKVVAFNGSPRKEGNTDILVRQVFTELHKEGSIPNWSIWRSCRSRVHGLLWMFTNRDKRCVIDDDLNACVEKMIDADGIILASPTYFANVSSETKALIDRAG